MTLNFQEKGDRRAYPGGSTQHRRCIAHYLMDGFSLCSVDSLTTGVPDCTLRRFSGATENPASPLYQEGDTVASLHNEQDAATPLELVLRAPRQPPCFPVAASRRLPAWPLPPPPPPPPLLPPPPPPLLPPSCNHVHPPHQPIISPYYVTSRCVTCLATPRRCSKCLVGNSKNDGEGKRARSCVPRTRGMNSKDQDIVRGRVVNGWGRDGWGAMPRRRTLACLGSIGRGVRARVDSI